MIPVNEQSFLERISKKPSVIPRTLLLSSHIAKALFTFTPDSEKVLDRLQNNLDKTNSYLRLILMAPSLGKALGQVRKLRSTIADWFDINTRGPTKISGDVFQKVIIDTVAPSVYEVSDTLKFFNKLNVIHLGKILPTIAGIGGVTGAIISAKKIACLASDYFAGRGENHFTKLVKNTGALALSIFTIIPQTRLLTLGIYTVYTAADISLNYLF